MPPVRHSKSSCRTPPLLVILGPTAAGKTDLAIALARKFNGEIISADSRQFYRGLDIGADIIPGKWVKRGARRVYIAQGVPHHLIAFRSPAKPITLAEFKTLAVRKAREIIKRGRLPILCGGTGLYVSAVADNFQMPEAPPDMKFRAACAKLPLDKLGAELVAKDSAYAARAGRNPRYIIRALEVMRATGRTMTDLQQKGEPLFDVLKIGVSRPREEMYRRIDQRVDRMMKDGLLKEAQRLGRRYGWDAPVLTSLGHRQLGGYLRGETTLEEAVRRIKRDTRRFAKRQQAWFKRDAAIRWVASPKTAFRLAGAWLKNRRENRGKSSR
ncbi:MAG: tRNA (adenosine(37)-N6)-dimethylallyltransferase MiaA [Patescibacteria group bacterium]|nr:tRNA (adenosine(37)-N6)-dimethylallyltransferase MiaA [Patescibacteria group bacterium]